MVSRTTSGGSVKLLTILCCNCELQIEARGRESSLSG